MKLNILSKKVINHNVLLGCKFIILMLALGLVAQASREDATVNIKSGPVKFLDELGTLEGFENKYGKFDKDKDLILIQTIDFGILYSQRPVSFMPLIVKGQKGIESLLSPILVKKEGVFQGEESICNCNVHVSTSAGENKKGYSTKFDCSDESAEMVCKGEFPISVFNDGREKVFVLNLESVENNKARIKYKDKLYQADLSFFQRGSYRESTTKYIEKQQEKIKEIVGDADFVTFRNKFTKCLENRDGTCARKYVDNSRFLVERGFEECSFHSELQSEDNFYICLESDKSNLRKVILECLKQNEFPMLDVGQEDVSVVEAITNPEDPSTFCIFSKKGSNWSLVSIGEY